MRHKTQDKTLYRNYVRKWKFLIQEYELVKQKRHPTFRFVADFYRFHQTHRQTFLKYDHRFRQSGQDQALVPQKRGPKWKRRQGYGSKELHSAPPALPAPICGGLNGSWLGVRGPDPARYASV